MMDKFKDNTGNDLVTSPSLRKPKKSGRKLLWVWTAGGAALLAALAFILAPAVFPSGAGKKGTDLLPLSAMSPSGAAEESFAPIDKNLDLTPLLYKESGEIYLAAGAESIMLGVTVAEGIGIFKGEVSPDGQMLYYLADFDDNSTVGDLMRITLGAENAKPELVEEGVDSAQISPDGKKILFLTGDRGLYIRPAEGGKPVLIDKSIYGYDYGFSVDGSYVYYSKTDSDYCQKLYLYSGGESKEIFKNNEAEGSGFEAYVDVNGRVLIKAGDFGCISNHPYYTVYLYDGSETKRVVNQASYVRALGRADEFIYVTPGNELAFYGRGDKYLVSDNGKGWTFACEIGRETIIRSADYSYGGKTPGSFVFTEGKDPVTFVVKDGVDDPDPSVSVKFTGYVLYEFTVKDGKVRISNESPDSSGAYKSPTQGGMYFYADTEPGRITYSMKGSLYEAIKAAGEWQETKVADYGEDLRFDESGNFIYYCSSPNSYSDNYELYRTSLSLYRMSPETGETEKLFTGVESYEIRNGECYVLNADGDIFYIKNGNYRELIQKDITGLFSAKDGIYTYNYMDGSYNGFTDLYFISGGKAERVCSNGQFMECSGLMPIPMP